MGSGAKIGVAEQLTCTKDDRRGIGLHCFHSLAVDYLYRVVRSSLIHTHLLCTMVPPVAQALPGIDARWEEFAHLFRRRTVLPGTILLKEGAVARRAFMIEKGCLRTVYDHKGRDITSQFFFEGEAVSSFESFQFGTPSLFRIEAVECTTLWSISRPDLDRLMQEIPDLRATANEHLLHRMAYYMRHLLSFLRDTPAERYALLRKERPEVLQRVPQYLIASYLGITPVSLSRIRARLKPDRAS